MLWLCMINPSGADPNLPVVTVCQSRPTAPMWLAPMDLVIGDTVALEVGAGRVAPDHLGPARVDALEPPGFTDRAELDRWVLGVVVYDWRVRQGPTAVFNPKHRGEGAAIEVRRRLNLDLRGRFAEHVRRKTEVPAGGGGLSTAAVGSLVDVTGGPPSVSVAVSTTRS